MSAVAAPADRRFRRSHIKPGRRTRTRLHRLKPVVGSAIVVLAVIYGGYRASLVIAHARVLQIDRIVVRGNQRMSQTDVLDVLDGLRGESLLWADLDTWRHRLLASPWVREAWLRRSLPSTVEVVVSERQPIGVARVSGTVYLVDERGVMIDEYGPRYADFDLPIIDGLMLSTRRDGTAPDEARAALAARVVAALKARPELARHLSQIDVSDPENASVILAGDSAQIALGDDQFLERLQRYLELASGLRGTVPEIDHVDARFENKLYVRPAGKPLEKKTARSPTSSGAGTEKNGKGR